jgi:hypothetical protein
MFTIKRWSFLGMYKWLNDIYDIKKQALLLQDKNYEAISLILETYTMQVITDAFEMHLPGRSKGKKEI